MKTKMCALVAIALGSFGPLANAGVEVLASGAAIATTATFSWPVALTAASGASTAYSLGWGKLSDEAKAEINKDIDNHYQGDEERLLAEAESIPKQMEMLDAKVELVINNESALGALQKKKLYLEGVMVRAEQIKAERASL